MIAALRGSLLKAGHDVTVVAPATNQSGSGTLITNRTVELANPEPDVWTVTGTPSDAVIVGLGALFAAEPPDLVVSGINPGGNYSSVVNHSGTVGAAITALENDVPAIAVSIDGKTAEQFVFLKDTVADYTSELVDKLARRSPGRALLPAGVGLNINYPGTDVVKGTTLTRQDPNSYIRFGFTNTTGDPGAPGTYSLSLGGPTGEPARGSDWSALQAGWVSITPIDTDLTAIPSDRTGVGWLKQQTPWPLERIAHWPFTAGF